MEAMGSESLTSGMEVGMKRGGVQKNVFIRWHLDHGAG